MEWLRKLPERWPTVTTIGGGAFIVVRYVADLGDLWAWGVGGIGALLFVVGILVLLHRSEILYALPKKKLRGVDQQTQIGDTQQKPLVHKAKRRERARHLREAVHQSKAIIKMVHTGSVQFGKIRSRMLELHRKMDQQIRDTSWEREFGYRQGSRELTDFTSTGIITEKARQIEGTQSDPGVRRALDELIVHLTTMVDRAERIVEDMSRD